MSEPFPVSVRRRRRDRGLTQQQLADLADVSRGTIRNIEGGMEPYAGTVARVENAFARFDESATAVAVANGPALVFVAPDGAAHAVDSDQWNASVLSPRDRTLLQALLGHVTARLSDPGPPDRPPTPDLKEPA
ncbi:XRE family transcriptional regulator [Nonomuraea terrae]|uniref:XRE family transcriptional regulator n=1 Tax=Nonomuraea terrae TaxID=2530383 RepID=A0A4R4ZDV8_9ACTN|nr:helix-turn-helix transcriptional regulator [Nonomuraea terrae]TDD54552.1 XRE family transcriptional regulator [Nonomuraea terrae]